MPDFRHQPIFEHGHDDTPYRKLTDRFVSTAKFDGMDVLVI